MKIQVVVGELRGQYRRAEWRWCVQLVLYRCYLDSDLRRNDCWGAVCVTAVMNGLCFADSAGSVADGIGLYSAGGAAVVRMRGMSSLIVFDTGSLGAGKRGGQSGHHHHLSGCALVPAVVV